MAYLQNGLNVRRYLSEFQVHLPKPINLSPLRYIILLVINEVIDIRNVR